MTGNRLKLNVTEELEGLRLDIFCSRKVTDRTRSYFTKLASSGHIFIDGEPAKPSHKVKIGMQIIVELVSSPPLEAQPEKIEIEVVYEDNRILVVNKPAGMVVHPAAGNYEGTLVNALLYHLGENRPGELRDPIRPGLVHRLDKNTSGLLVVARDESALAFLQREIKLRNIHRQYVAITWGNVELTEGTIDLPIGRSERDRKKMVAFPRHGREAVTHFRVTERFGLATLVQLKLETGRTHQIRVHLAHSGYPVLGDPEYGGRSTYLRRLGKKDKSEAVILLGLIDRQALHAERLALPHPDDGRVMSFESNLPSDMDEVLRYLRKTFEK